MNPTEYGASLEQHQPTDEPAAPEQYRIVAEFDAPIDECFKAGTAEEAMMVWVPNIRSVHYDHTKADVPYGAGSFRLVTMKGGMSVIERVLISEPPALLVYSIEASPFVNRHVLKNYRGHMSFTALSPHKTRLTWFGHFESAPLLRPVTRTIIRGLISTFAQRMTGYLAARRSG